MTEAHVTLRYDIHRKKTHLGWRTAGNGNDILTAGSVSRCQGNKKTTAALQPGDAFVAMVTEAGTPLTRPCEFDEAPDYCLFWFVWYCAPFPAQYFGSAHFTDAKASFCSGKIGDVLLEYIQRQKKTTFFFITVLANTVRTRFAMALQGAKICLSELKVFF